MIKKIKEAFDSYAFKRSMFRKARLSFSQFGEDILLESFFGRKQNKGFYVDVGAFHPVRFSNTCLFYRKGWSGINIEPHPEHFKLFSNARKRDINLNLAISDKKSDVEFNCDGAFSGIKDEKYTSKNRSEKASVIKVKTHTLEKILEKYLPKETTIDFMTIDCEGHDEKVIQSNDWILYRPKVVLVEQHGDKIQGGIYNHLLKYDYKFYCRIGLTLVFFTKEESLGYLP